MTLLFAAVCAALLWLIGGAVWSILRPERRTWPPLRREGIVYRLNSLLGPGTNVGIAALAVLGWDSFDFEHWLRFPIGGSLFAAGGYFGLGGFLSLGLVQSTGHRGELVATGPYRFSRNPQYVGAVFAFLGLGVICNSAPALGATLLASVWLLMLPFAEEPWLREQLGAAYDAYAARVPRYLGLPREREAPSPR